LFLKQIQNRGVLISVDTALKPLLSRNIQPHFTAIADPSYKNQTFAPDTKSPPKKIIMEPSIEKII